MKECVTINLVYYDDLDLDYFYKSLYSALSQVGVDCQIKVFWDSLNEVIELPKNVIISSVPFDIQGNPSRIREFIVQQVNTEYLAFWDSDDVYTPDRLYHQLSEIKKQDGDVCFSNFSFFNENKIFQEDFFSQIGLNKREINIFDENYFGFGIMTARVTYLKSLLPFPDIKVLDWWIGIKSKLVNAKTICLYEIHGFYRVHSLSQSRKTCNITADDFKNERDTKIRLYDLFSDEQELCQRKAFFENIDIDACQHILKEKYINNKYKNIWGGLIKYENK